MSPELDDALRRLTASVGLLEASVAQRLAAEAGKGDLQTELQIMGDDRARLAAELEGATDRLHRLQTASDHVAGRLECAVATIDEVLAEVDGEPPPGDPPTGEPLTAEPVATGSVAGEG